MVPAPSLLLVGEKPEAGAAFQIPNLPEDFGAGVAMKGAGAPVGPQDPAGRVTGVGVEPDAKGQHRTGPRVALVLHVRKGTVLAHNSTEPASEAGLARAVNAGEASSRPAPEWGNKIQEIPDVAVPPVREGGENTGPIGTVLDPDALPALAPAATGANHTAISLRRLVPPQSHDKGPRRR